MKNNLLDKAIRLILGIASILPQKKSGTAKSNRNTPATAAASTAHPKADKNLKPETIITDSETDYQKSSKTLSDIPNEAAKEEKSTEYIPKKSTLKDPNDSVETRISPDEKQEDINGHTEENNIYRSDLIEKKTSTAVIPLSSLGLSAHLFNRLRASNIKTVDN